MNAVKKCACLGAAIEMGILLEHSTFAIDYALDEVCPFEICIAKNEFHEGGEDSVMCHMIARATPFALSGLYSELEGEQLPKVPRLYNLFKYAVRHRRPFAFTALLKRRLPCVDFSVESIKLPVIEPLGLSLPQDNSDETIEMKQHVAAAAHITARYYIDLFDLLNSTLAELLIPNLVIIVRSYANHRPLSPKLLIDPDL